MSQAKSNPHIIILRRFLLVFLWMLATFSASVQTSEHNTIVFGIPPWDTDKQLLHKYQPLMTYLSQQLKAKVIMVVTADYADLERQLGSGTIDIGFMPAVSYIQAKQNLKGLSILAGQTDLHPVTGELRDHYRGLIVTLKSSGITELAQLKDTRFGFTDKNSSSGYKYPLQLFADKGIKPKTFFSQTFMLKKHPKVTQALINGAIDAGATFDVHLAQAIEEYGDIFNVIAQTRPIPFEAVVASPHISRSIAHRIKELLLTIKPPHPVLLQMQHNGLATYGWQPTSDSHYNSVRRILDSHSRNDNIKQLIFGVTESKTAYRMHKMWSPLLTELSKDIGLPVTMQIVKKHQELISRIQNGQFDIGMFRAFAYVKAKDAIPELHYVATTLKQYANGRISDHYNGVLITLKENNINSLADLKNKRFGFTSTSSTSGYLYPVSLLKRHNIDLKRYFSHTFMLNKHNKIVKSLLSHSIDAGATTDDELFRATLKYGDIFTTINKTDNIPFDAITIAPHLSKEIRIKIEKFLLTVKDSPPLMSKLKQSGWKYRGFSKQSDTFYDSVRQVRDTMSKVTVK